MQTPIHCLAMAMIATSQRLTTQQLSKHAQTICRQSQPRPSGSSSRDRLIKDCKISDVEIYEYFANNCQKPDNPWLLTRLFFSVASPEAFVQLKDVYHHLKNNKILIHFHWTNKVSEHMKSLDQLTTFFTACYMLERCILVQLVNRRDELVRKYKAQPGRKLKKTTEAKKQLRLPRADGLGFSAIMEEAYPMVKKGDNDYDQRQTTLRNKLSKG